MNKWHRRRSASTACRTVVGLCHRGTRRIPRDNATNYVLVRLRISGEKFGFDRSITDDECPPYPTYWKAILVPLLIYLAMKYSEPWVLISSVAAPCNTVYLALLIAVFTTSPYIRYHIPRWSMYWISFVAIPLISPDSRNLTNLSRHLSFAVH